MLSSVIGSYSFNQCFTTIANITSFEHYESNVDKLKNKLSTCEVQLGKSMIHV